MVLMLLGSGLPLLELGGSNPAVDAKLVPLLGTKLKILPGENDMVLDLVIDCEQ